MNILQINKGDNLGGAAKVVFRLHEEFRKKRHFSHILVDEKITKDKDVVVLEKNKEFKLKEYLMKGLGLAEFFLYNKPKIINNYFFKQADIINLHNLHVRYFNLNQIVEICKFKPVVWTLHDMWAFTGHCAHSLDCQRWKNGCGQCPQLDIYPHLKIDVTSWLWKKKESIYNNSDFIVVAPSKWLKKKAEKSMLANKRIELIYHGVDEQAFKPQNRKMLRRKLNLPLEKKIICFVAQKGSENIWKGGNFLKKIINEFRTDEDKVFIEIGGYQKSIENEGRVIKIPYIMKADNLAEYYAAADILLFTSLAESFGLVVIEAMACGLPVVAFDTGPMSEIIKHLRTGYLARYKDLQDLKAGVNLLLSNDKLLNDNRFMSRQRVQSYFTLRKQVDNYLKIYRSLR